MGFASALPILPAITSRTPPNQLTLDDAGLMLQCATAGAGIALVFEHVWPWESAVVVRRQVGSNEVTLVDPTGLRSWPTKATWI